MSFKKVTYTTALLQAPGFAPDAQIIWAVTHGSLYPATSLKIANQLFKTYTADNGLRVCDSQLTLGHKASSVLGSSRLGVQAWELPVPELTAHPGLAGVLKSSSLPFGTCDVTF